MKNPVIYKSPGEWWRIHAFFNFLLFCAVIWGIVLLIRGDTVPAAAPNRGQRHYDVVPPPMPGGGVAPLETNHPLPNGHPAEYHQKHDRSKHVYAMPGDDYSAIYIKDGTATNFVDLHYAGKVFRIHPNGEVMMHVKVETVRK